MKRTFLILATLIAIAGLGFAQVPPKAPLPIQDGASIVKLDGRLALVNGFIGLQSKDKTYYVHIPGHLYGFIDGLKEGAQVKLEGYEQVLAQAPEYAHFFVTKLTVGGKDYDLSNARGMGFGGGMGRGSRHGGGMMGGGRFQDDDDSGGRGRRRR